MGSQFTRKQIAQSVNAIFLQSFSLYQNPGTQSQPISLTWSQLGDSILFSKSISFSVSPDDKSLRDQASLGQFSLWIVQKA